MSDTRPFFFLKEPLEEFSISSIKPEASIAVSDEFLRVITI